MEQSDPDGRQKVGMVIAKQPNILRASPCATAKSAVRRRCQTYVTAGEHGFDWTPRICPHGVQSFLGFTPFCFGGDSLMRPVHRSKTLRQAPRRDQLAWCDFEKRQNFFGSNLL
jgi:hypothetical protein